MLYKKQEAQMTRGLAILSMVILHLFCRKGSQIICEPLLWINKETPFIYWFGFFAEICVPLYSICVGYARYSLYKKDEASCKDNIQRIFKLLLNYWLVVILFCGFGLLFGASAIPGSFTNFLKSLDLLHSYNGAWWYLNTYVILLLIPTAVLLFPVRKLKSGLGIVGCCVWVVVYYLAGRFDLLAVFSTKAPILAFTEKEFVNIAHVLPFVWLGAIFCKINAFEKCKIFLDNHFTETTSQILVGGDNRIVSYM